MAFRLNLSFSAKNFGMMELMECNVTVAKDQYIFYFR